MPHRTGARGRWALNTLRLPSGDDVYNICMSRGWYRLAEATTRAGINAVEKNFEAIGDFLCDYFARERPALVVSFIPNINRVLREGLKHVLPGVRLLTVITDMETTPGACIALLNTRVAVHCLPPHTYSRALPCSTHT